MAIVAACWDHLGCRGRGRDGRGRQTGPASLFPGRLNAADPPIRLREPTSVPPIGAMLKTFVVEGNRKIILLEILGNAVLEGINFLF